MLGCTKIKTDVAPVSRKGRLFYQIPYRWLVARSSDNSGYGSACPPEAVDRDRAVLKGMRYSKGGVWAQSKAIANYALPLTEAASVATPALVLHGDEDTAISIEEAQVTASTLQDARLVIYPGAGHNFLACYPEKVVADVLDFIGTQTQIAR